MNNITIRRLSGMSGMILGEATMQKAAKEHDCWWCGELIFQHENYARWTWKDGNGLLSVKVHEECRTAWNQLPQGEREVGFAEFSRGCDCDHGGTTTCPV